MANDLERFARRIRQHGRNIEVNANREVVKLGSLVSQTVISGTPVDEGFARGNWFATLGSPRLTADFEKKDPSGQETIAENNAIIARRRSGQAVYISNNLPYIKRLNEGWSSQAPAGYVEKAIQAARRAMKGARLLRR